MSEAELLEIADRLTNLVASSQPDETDKRLNPLMDAANQIARSWSRSNLGYQASVYYAGFQEPPAGAHFSSEWGFAQLQSIRATTGDWREYRDDDVIDEIFKRAGRPKVVDLVSLGTKLRDEFSDAKEGVVSILTAELASTNDGYLKRKLDEASAIEIFGEDEFRHTMLPSGQIISRDSLAIGQGLRVAPHQSVMATIAAIKAPIDVCKKLSDVARQAGSHLRRIQAQQKKTDQLVGTNVFIGHGQSLLWRELKDFVHDRLGLP
ncbi:MAG: hypothetical protein WB689_18510, partial [Xanthobacteraceae bacterium]